MDEDHYLIRRLMNISEKVAKERKEDPELQVRMEIAAQGQSPRYLIISPLRRSSQDLQLLNMDMGDAFHATRVSGHALPPPNSSIILFKGPASFNREFPEKKGVIVTFEYEEPGDIIRKTLENLKQHPDLDELPIIALKVNYEYGRANLIAHGKGRDYEAENQILSRIQQPETLDEDILVLLCSDSRVDPPHTENGIPMAIRTLGGYVPPFSEAEEETQQLSAFFEEWLDASDRVREILIVTHGNFEGAGSSCEAVTVSLTPDQIQNNSLRPAIEALRNAAEQFEQKPPNTPEDRMKSLSSAIRENLLTYLVISAAMKNGQLSIDELFMDTVTNVLYQDESNHDSSCPE